jgi:hypothetical protein
MMTGLKKIKIGVMNECMIIILVLSSMSYAYAYGKELETNKCQNINDIVSYNYINTIMKSAMPDTKNLVLVSISIIVNSSKKYVIYATTGDQFNIKISDETRNMYNILDELNKSCQLPINPNNTKNLISFNWKDHVIDKNKFINIHNEFIKAINDYTTNVKKRTDELLVTQQAYAALHTDRYWIIYKNDRHNIEFIQDDIDEEGQNNPIITWAKNIIKKF